MRKPTSRHNHLNSKKILLPRHHDTTTPRHKNPNAKNKQPLKFYKFTSPVRPHSNSILSPSALQQILPRLPSKFNITWHALYKTFESQMNRFDSSNHRCTKLVPIHPSPRQDCLEIIYQEIHTSTPEINSINFNYFEFATLCTVL